MVASDFAVTSMTAVRLSPFGVAIRLRCPVCNEGVPAHDASAASFVCSTCRTTFPIRDDVPLLINEARSIFRVSDFAGEGKTTFVANGTLAERIGRIVPSPSLDVGRLKAYRKMAQLLQLRPSSQRRILVVGCGDGTAGYDVLESVEGVEILETDVSLAGPARLICDASDLPFAGDQFDLIICQAVLEHVLEPQRCVDEMHRVLREDGLLYATTPFMQHVHMGAFDFTRFTRSGHRWLFRNFHEVESGMATGPASMLIWSVEYFLMAFSASVAWRRFIKAVVRICLGWLTLTDRWFAHRMPAFDAAGGFYFLGRRSAAAAVSAREMIGYYVGADDRK